jgi:hypothetical protein
VVAGEVTKRQVGAAEEASSGGQGVGDVSSVESPSGAVRWEEGEGGGPAVRRRPALLWIKAQALSQPACRLYAHRAKTM